MPTIQDTCKATPSTALSLIVTLQKNRLDHLLDAESAWRLFLGETSPNDSNRYVRLNPDLGTKVPSLDDIASMKAVQDRAKLELQTATNEILIKRTAYRLISSTFFFEKDASIRIKGGIDATASTYTCNGNGTHH